MTDLIKWELNHANAEKETRKAIQKSLKKIVNKHAPTVVEHLWLPVWPRTSERKAKRT
jgi:hypothetical protein